MNYNEYQQMHHRALYGPPKQVKKKEYALFENGVQGLVGPYPLLQHERNTRIRNGVPAYLLKIKPINNK